MDGHKAKLFETLWSSDFLSYFDIYWRITQHTKKSKDTIKHSVSNVITFHYQQLILNPISYEVISFITSLFLLEVDNVDSIVGGIVAKHNQIQVGRSLNCSGIREDRMFMLPFCPSDILFDFCEVQEKVVC